MPVIPLVDVVASVGTAPPWQIVELVAKPNVGVTLGTTDKVNVVPFAHCPEFGVNVYVPAF